MTLRTRAVDLVFGALEGMASLYDFVRGLQKAVQPPKARPLTYRDVVHQQTQIRSATRRDAIRPPGPSGP